MRSKEPDSRSARPGTQDATWTVDASSAGRPVLHRLEGLNDVPDPPVDDDFTRRTALKMFSATALLTAAGCTRKPKRHVIAVTDRVEYRRPGIPLYYASTWTDGAFPYGMLVKTIDGRPIKIEGLPDHPLSAGNSTAQMQASVLTLYDPERMKGPKKGGAETTWEEADKAITTALKQAGSAVVVTRGLLGPSERALLGRFTAAVRGARHFVYEPGDDRARRSTWKRLYGGDGLLVPRFDKAKVILSIDADFLSTDGDVLSATREYAAGRKAAEGKPLSRLYVAESTMSLTGSNADHRVGLRPSAMAAFVKAVSDGVRGGSARLDGVPDDLLAALAGDLRKNRGAAVVVAGPHLPAEVHVAVAKLNDAIGAAGKTLFWNPSPATLPADDPAEIAAALEAGPDVALFLGVNPVHDWAGGGFETLLAKARLSVGHALTENETLEKCTYALPSCHCLESWNDATPAPGLRGFCQPMIAPLFDGRQEAESLLLWLKAIRPGDVSDKSVKDFHDYVRSRWDGDTIWTECLRKGIAGTATPLGAPRSPGSVSTQPGVAPAPGTVDIVFATDATTGDGRFAGNAWLLEHPDPVSKLVWDNAALLAPATAERLGVEKGHWVTLESGGASLDLPVLVQPGVAAGAVIVTMGYGRTAGAGVGNLVGINVAPLRAAAKRGAEGAGRVAMGARIRKADREWYPLVRTQGSFDQEPGGDARAIALSGTVEQRAADPRFVHQGRHIPKLDQIDQPWDYSKGRKWGMAIDLNACTSCGACMIACQSENNIQVVGKEECGNNRDMPWIRLDRYEWFDEKHDPEHANPIVDTVPMLCQHCDNAPCETVCPVNATSHSPEGLNEQVYNRCVGTRYCLNNCPYKVRSFNFYNYTRRNVKTPEQELRYNPHVTVRMRGVMEKCTFCIQRINEAKFKAENAAESSYAAKIPDGTIKPACQQSCPADAIVFGDVNDKESKVAKARENDLAYHVLEELNVRPNVTYLAKVRNPHPDVAATAAAFAAKHAKGH